MESNLNTAKELEPESKTLKTEHSLQNQKKGSEAGSQLSKSIGMQALGSENFGVPISTAKEASKAQGVATKAKGKNRLQKKASLLNKGKMQRKKSEDEEKRKRDQVLKELEVLNEEYCPADPEQEEHEDVEDDASDQI